MTAPKEDDPRKLPFQPKPTILRWAQCSIALNVVILTALLHAALRPIVPFSFPIRLWPSPSLPPSGSSSLSSPPPEFHECRAPLPPFLATQPPSGAETPLREALDLLDAALRSEFNKGGMDSLSVAVVGSEGSLYEGFWGPRRANESDAGRDVAVDRHSIYRIASVSKLFTSIETLILRDHEVLQLDDPISFVLPEFEYNAYYAPITYRALMTHMSGIGRDLPAGDARGHWPKSLFGQGPPTYNGLEFPSRQQVFDAIANARPVVPPYTYPVYSNTGFALLGMANVAANKEEHGECAPSTHAELVKQDIFDPLGLDDSGFVVTRDNIDRVVVPSVNAFEIDQDFLDPMYPSGGQMSSLSDLVKLMQVLINPARPESILSPYTVREWMRPMHAWFDDYSAVGALWEIRYSTDAYGRRQHLYQKVGELAGYHSAFTLNPVNAYGIVVLQSGPTSEIVRLTKLITSYVQVAFDRLLEDTARERLAGTWRSSDGRVSLTVVVDRGSLYVSEYTIEGTDVLQVVAGDGFNAVRLPLWPTNEDEYRLVAPADDEGCFSSWVSLDMYGYVDGISTNVIVARTTGVQAERVFYLPAIDAELHRESSTCATP